MKGVCILLNKHILSDIRGFALRESENGICQFHAQADTKAFVIMRFGCAFYARCENIIKSVG